ncbi:4392_t:CDS:2, partial [Paraglomus brasilianum]
VFIRLKPEIETASQGILFGVREECLDRGLIVQVKGFLPYRSSSDLVNTIAKFIRWKGNTVLGWYVAPTPDIVDRHDPTHIASSYFRTFHAAMLKVITANYIPNHTDCDVPVFATQLSQECTSLFQHLIGLIIRPILSYNRSSHLFHLASPSSPLSPYTSSHAALNSSIHAIQPLTSATAEAFVSAPTYEEVLELMGKLDDDVEDIVDVGIDKELDEFLEIREETEEERTESSNGNSNGNDNSSVITGDNGDNGVSSDNNGNVNDKSTVSELASPIPNPSPFTSDDPTASHSKQTPIVHTPSPQPHPYLSSPTSTSDMHLDAQPTAIGYDLNPSATGRRPRSRRASTTDMDRMKSSKNDWGRKGEGVSKGKRQKEDNNNIGSSKKARTNHGDCVIPVPLTIISGQGSEYLHNSFIEHSLYTSQISPIDLSPHVSSFFSYYSPTTFPRTSPPTYPIPHSHHYDHSYIFSPSSSPTSNFPPTTLPSAVSSVNISPLHHRLHSTLSAITSHLTTHTQEKIRLYEKSCQEYELLLEILEGLDEAEDDFENAREQESKLRSQLTTPTGTTDIVMTDANEIIDNENNSSLPSKHPSDHTASTPPIELIEIMDENDMSTIHVNPGTLLTSSTSHINDNNNSQQSITEDKLTESSPEDGEIADDSECNEEKQGVDKEIEETRGQAEEKMQAQKEKDVDRKGEKDLTEGERDTDKDVKREEEKEEGEQNETGITETKQDKGNKTGNVKVKDETSEWAWDEEDIG